MARPKGGDDPTRTKPGGSRTETKITESSELGSDNGGDVDAPPPEAPSNTGDAEDR